MLERLAVEDEARDGDEPGDVHTREAGFRVEVAGVATDCAGGDEVVLQAVVGFAEEFADDGGEEEEAEGVGGEALFVCLELVRRGEGCLP